MRSLVVSVVSVLSLLIACSSVGHNDGKIISEKILKTPTIDSVTVSVAVSQLDTLITPEIFGRDFAITLVTLAERDTIIDGVELNKRVKLLRNVLTSSKGIKAFARFNEGMQGFIDGLPTERKMRVYAKIATPEQLGTALRIDRYHTPEDSVVINEQVQILRNVYSNDEFSSFLKYFNR